MRFAICNETFVRWSLEDICRRIHELGYDGIELAPFTLAEDVGQLSRHDRTRIRDTIRHAELATVGLHWLLAHTQGLHLTSPDPLVRTATANYLIELARLCRDVGGEVLVLGSPQQRRLLPGITQQAGRDYATEIVHAILPALDDNNVVLAVEPLAPHECNFLASAHDAVGWIESINHPRVQLHLDAKAMSYESRPIPEIITQYAERLAHFHANDPNLLGPGMGALDFHPILSTLKTVGYDGWISVEVFATGPGPEIIAQQSITYLRTLP